MPFCKKTTLPSGLRVVTESIPHVRSVAVGVWVGAGSASETPDQMGISHVLEHMLFKGTARRTAKEISRTIDARGGNLNAFTSREHTCYHAKVLDEHLPVAIDLLADMIQHSLLEPAELIKEQGVIIEEIKMYDDAPDELVYDLHSQLIFPNHPLGWPIAGKAATVQQLTAADLRAYLAHHYTPDQMVVAAAGNLEHDQVVELVAKAFTDLNGSGPQRVISPPMALAANQVTWRVKPDSEQLHLLLGVQGYPLDHPDLYALHVLNTVLGGSASSRLFQEIREERGLTYSIYSFQAAYKSSGLFGVYAGCSPKQAQEVLALILAEWARIAAQPLTAEELGEAKEQLKGQIVLGLESTSGRMARLGRGELHSQRVKAPDELLALIDAVTCEQVLQVAGQLLAEQAQALALVGPEAPLSLTDFERVEV